MVAVHAWQLRAMLDGAQEAVAGGQLVSVRASDVAALTQRVDSFQRRAYAQEGVGAPVDQLQELHGKLDVA